LAGTFFFTRDTKLIQGIGPLRRLASISLTEQTTASRFLIWNMAYQGFKEKPILGWGQENFIFVFEKYYHPAMFAQEPWFDRAHNIFFDWLIAGGALGLLSYLSLFVLSFYSLWKSYSLSVVQKSLLASLLVGYFFHNIFVFDNIASYLLFILVLALISFKSRGGEEAFEEVSRKEYLSSYIKAFTPIIIILIIFSVYFFNAKGYLTSRTVLKALAPQAEGVAKNLEFFKKALAYDTYGNQEVREQLLNAASRVLSLDVPQEFKDEFVTFGREEMQKQIDSNPISARAQIFMGSFLSRLGLRDEARLYLEEGLKLSPKKQLIYFELVTNDLNAGDLAKAEEFAKTAYELDERFSDARIIYVVTLIYNNKISEAEEISTEVFDENFGDERIARAYFTAGDFTRSILQWRNLINIQPNNIQFRISLAATLLGAGRRNEAVEVLEQAIEASPEFKEQGEFFIREIQAGRNP